MPKINSEDVGKINKNIGGRTNNHQERKTVISPPTVEIMEIRALYAEISLLRQSISMLQEKAMGKEHRVDEITQEWRERYKIEDQETIGLNIENGTIAINVENV
jgi:hypothetical protein